MGGIIAIGAATIAQAQQAGPASPSIDRGKYEYETHCAVCHGSSGKGDGIYASLFKAGTVVANLTELSKKNGGVFPSERVYEAIDTGKGITAHGTKEMPIWGPRYRIEAGQGFYDDYTDAYVRTRILALTDYIYRLQAK
jgi:mono/diheme cytochrome c family protein